MLKKLQIEDVNSNFFKFKYAQLYPNVNYFFSQKIF